MLVICRLAPNSAKHRKQRLKSAHQLRNERLHLRGREAHGVCRKIAHRVVQIDIVPHRLERDVRRAHVRDDLLDRGDVRVAPAAEVEPEAPVRLPGRRADDLGVLLHYGLRGGPGEEVEVEHAADEAVFDEGDVGGGRGEEEDVRAVGAGELISVCLFRGRGGERT